MPASLMVASSFAAISGIATRVASIHGAVFVHKNGKPIRSIREAVNLAREKAGIPNAIPHDIRRSTIRRWEALGISRQAVMQATGHRPVTIHEKYAELSEGELIEAFQPLMRKKPVLQAKRLKTA
jgi:integrase